jgi:hypothetical protein
MKKLITLFLCTGIVPHLYAQELFVFTEPASNMPANSVTGKLTSVFGERPYNTVQQRYIPEVMFGFSRKLMVHAAATFSNMQTKGVAPEGAYLYGKYRFYSADEMHRHFRMAIFAEGSYSRNKMLMYQELSLQGDISGVQGGLIATQLVNKAAVSATASYTHLLQTGYVNHAYINRALNYALSAGYLVLPREYKSYDQLNINVYGELLAQQTFADRSYSLNAGSSYYLDAAPSIQFIIKSNSKINMGYRFQVAGNAFRNYSNSFLLSFEHTFFNALKRKSKGKSK